MSVGILEILIDFNRDILHSSTQASPDVPGNFTIGKPGNPRGDTPISGAIATSARDTGIAIDSVLI